MTTTSPPRYQLLEILGQGAQGRVSRAHDRERGRDVVIKVFLGEADQQAGARFLRECRVLSGLDHPGIVPILDQGTLPDGSLYYTMPYDPSARSLERFLAEEGPAEPECVRSLAHDLAVALDHLHAHGFLHRDLKPSNILVLDGARALPGAPNVRPGAHLAQLMDFGLVRGAGLHTKLTETGAVVGTMAYLSPEQIQGAAVSPRSDLYQMGLILYELIVGARAVQNTADYLMRVTEGLRPLPLPSERRPSIDEELEEILLQALDLEPSRRFPTGAALIEALDRIPLDRWFGGSSLRDGATTLATVRPEIAISAGIPAPPASPPPPSGPSLRLALAVAGVGAGLLTALLLPPAPVPRTSTVLSMPDLDMEPSATTAPNVPEGARQALRIPLITRRCGSTEGVPTSTADVTLTTTPPGLPCLEGTAHLGRLVPGMRVELEAWLSASTPTTVEVVVNHGTPVRLAASPSPGSSIPAPTSLEIHDLVEGTNLITLRATPPGGPPVTLHPPGLALRVTRP